MLNIGALTKDLDEQEESLKRLRDEADRDLSKIATRFLDEPGHRSELAVEASQFDQTALLADAALEKLQLRRSAAVRESFEGELSRLDTEISNLEARRDVHLRPYLDHIRVEEDALEATGKISLRSGVPAPVSLSQNDMVNALEGIRRRAPRPTGAYTTIVGELDTLRNKRGLILAQLNGHAQ